MRLSAALVLSAPPGQVLTSQAMQSVLGVLDEEAVLDAGWISAEVCFRALFTYDDSVDLTRLRARARAALASFPVDVNLAPDDLAYTKKRLLAADMESTLIEQEMIDEIAREVGIWEEISRITAATMRGELPFEASLRERVRRLEGLDVKRLLDLTPRITLMPGAEALFRGLKREGIKSAIITGGFSIYAELIGARLGADEVVANRLDIKNGRLTGDLLDPVIGVSGKEDALRKLATSSALDLMETAAVGDGANDLAMLAAAGLGVAFRSKPNVREAQLSMTTGAVIDHADLSALLDLQGLSRGEATR